MLLIVYKHDTAALATIEVLQTTRADEVLRRVDCFVAYRLVVLIDSEYVLVRILIDPRA